MARGLSIGRTRWIDRFLAFLVVIIMLYDALRIHRDSASKSSIRSPAGHRLRTHDSPRYRVLQ